MIKRRTERANKRDSKTITFKYHVIISIETESKYKVLVIHISINLQSIRLHTFLFGLYVHISGLNGTFFKCSYCCCTHTHTHTYKHCVHSKPKHVLFINIFRSCCFSLKKVFIYKNKTSIEIINISEWAVPFNSISPKFSDGKKTNHARSH